MEIVKVAGLIPAQRSKGGEPTSDVGVYVADTLGELGLFYRLAPIVFMGGSLIMHGGQNPIEPIKLGAAVVHGPHVTNFADLYATLDTAHGAEQVADEEALTTLLGNWLAKASARQAVASAGAKTVDTLGGALKRTLAALDPYLMQLRLEQREA